MTELLRNCSGGIVFYQEKVFLLMSDRGEWVMPKGVIREGNRSNEIALWRVEDEAGIQAEIIGIAGNTLYHFFSETRQREVTNRIQWFAMRAKDEHFRVAYEQGFLDGKYYTIDEARERITHEKDLDVLNKAWKIYQRTCMDDVG